MLLKFIPPSKPLEGMPKKHEVHIWVIHLDITSKQEKQQAMLLSKDEIQRAKRFHFPVHKKRFIATRSILRKILANYLNIPPQEIIFGYTAFQKPYLIHPNHTSLQFNVAHSHDMAALAISSHDAIGIDIEQIQSNYPQEIVQRYFSQEEYKSWRQLSAKDQAVGFFRLWSRKEAIVKAIGKGLSIPLSSFTVSMHHESEIIAIENESWTLVSLAIHTDYQAALATNQPIKTIKIEKFN